jgi:hypothetical protein
VKIFIYFCFFYRSFLLVKIYRVSRKYLITGILLSAPFSARDESVQKVPRNVDAVVIVDTEEGEENIDDKPVFFL